MSLITFEWPQGQNRPADASPILSLQAISVHLGHRLVLDKLSLEVYPGEVVRITGPNGAGKSTLLNAIMGIIPVTEGKIVFDGEDVTDLPTHERATMGISYMRQRANIFPSLSVMENLQLALGRNSYDRFKEAYAKWAVDLPPKRIAGMLSGGQKQMLAWAMSVLKSHKLLLADEPLAGVADNVFFSTKLDSTVLKVEHD